MKMLESKSLLGENRDDGDIKGTCPVCSKVYEASFGKPVFFQRRKGKRIKLLHAFCSTCYSGYAKSKESKQREIRQLSVEKVFSGMPEPMWTVVSDLALGAHFGDFLTAWRYGIDLPRVVFDAYDDGEIEDLLLLPIGGVI